MKLILLTFLTILNANAITNNELFFKDPLLNRSIGSFQKQHKTYTKAEAKTFLYDFRSMTGESEENFNKMIEITVNDKDWQDGTNSFKNDFKEIDIHGAKKVIPKWKPALESFKKSVVEKHNVISAFDGLTIVSQYFTGYEGGKEISKNVIENNLPIFANLLAEKGYCYGYLYSVKSALEYNNNLDLALKYGEAGFPICAKQLADKKIEKWVDLEFRKLYVKAKQIKRERDKELK